MCGVTSPAPRAQHPAVRRRRVLCVLALLAGLLAMHGLAPGGAAPQPQHMPQARMAQPSDRSEAQDGCGQGGHCGGGHVQHADTTCASGAVGGGPVLPALVADPVAVGVPEDVVQDHTAVEQDGARAPPSLAELQLLRI
ncbi:DUF6153 family protein [Streptomyces sp. NPDC006372]|uniref:DUF6153 family protein n=1 Tax=Streptomyces sp. NPDC006372 TaxID=3155599 RepID=UPI0033BB176F